MNGKELFLSALRGETGYMGYAFNAFPPGFPVVWDPVTMLDAAFMGESYVDLWGATWRHLASDPGAIPMVTEENKVIRELSHWRDYIKFPSLDGLDWTGADAQLAHIDRENTLVMVPSFYGPFERAHALMPFDEVLLNMQLEPECMYELFGALTDWKIAALEKVIDHMHPDIIHSHDDFGSLTRLFFSPELFRKLLKPHYKRMYDFIHGKGVLVQHHADCYCQGLERDFLEMGADMWEGVAVTNDIQRIKRNTGGKLLLLGGLDQNLIDRADVPEERIRAEVRRAIDTCAPGGSWLPCIPSMVPVNLRTLDIVVSECNGYGEKWMADNR